MKAKWIIISAAVVAGLGLTELHLSGQSNEPPRQQSTPAYTDPQANIQRIFGPTKQIEVRDPFFNNMVAYTITIPKDWFFEGTVLHGPGCMGLLYQSIAFRAYSPDASSGVQVMPRQEFYYWEDPNARPLGAACKFYAPMSSTDFAAMFAYRMRPNAQIERSEPTLDVEQARANFERNNEDLARSASQLRMPSVQSYPDFTRTRIHYDWEGYQEEEWLRVEMVYNDMPKSVFIYNGGPNPGHAAWRHFLKISSAVSSRRAPRGKLDDYDPALVGILNTVQLNPQFVQASNQQQQALTNSIVHSIQNQMIVDRQNSKVFMDAMTAQHNAFMASQNRQFNQHQSEMAGQMNRQDAETQRFIGQMNASTARTRDYQDILLDQQYYVNPQTGETATVSGRMMHTWANGPLNSNATSIVQSPNPNFNPNGVLGYGYNQLMPIHH